MSVQAYLNQEYRDTLKWDKPESADRCVIVGRPLRSATATDRLGITTIKDSL
jgi:hypothetical protein